jgi:hypothetical protein
VEFTDLSVNALEQIVVALPAWWKTALPAKLEEYRQR